MLLLAHPISVRKARESSPPALCFSPPTQPYASTVFFPRGSYGYSGRQLRLASAFHNRSWVFGIFIDIIQNGLCPSDMSLSNSATLACFHRRPFSARVRMISHSCYPMPKRHESWTSSVVYSHFSIRLFGKNNTARNSGEFRQYRTGDRYRLPHFGTVFVSVPIFFRYRKMVMPV